MPTIHREKGYHFRFFSNEGDEPCHVHIRGKGGIMKVWLPSVMVADVRGYSPKQQREILDIIRAGKAEMIEAWHEHFSKKK
jgi:hypothetical protein